MLRALIYKQTSSLGSRWVCRLYESGGYTWHGQVAHTDFSGIAKDEFIAKCEDLFGKFTLSA